MSKRKANSDLPAAEYKEEWGTVSITKSVLAQYEFKPNSEELWLTLVAPHYLEHSNASQARVSFGTRFQRSRAVRGYTDESFKHLLDSNLAGAKQVGVTVHIYTSGELQNQKRVANQQSRRQWPARAMI
jgi:hypothetical protein